eukprot:2909431-Prymnesium_polylepis.1
MKASRAPLDESGEIIGAADALACQIWLVAVLPRPLIIVTRASDHSLVSSSRDRTCEGRAARTG